MQKSIKRLMIMVFLCVGANAQGQPGGGQWRVNATPKRCSLGRSFVDPSGVSIRLATVPGSGLFELVILGKALPAKRAGERYPASIVFRDSDARFDLMANAVAPADPTRGQAVMFGGMTDSFSVAFGQAKSLTIETEGATIGPYLMMDADKAIADLDKCIDNQLTNWGADPAQFAIGGSKAKAIGDPERWLTPRQLLRVTFKTAQLDAILRLSVAVDGTVDGCGLLEPIEGANVEAAICPALLKQKLYIPAHDQRGNAVRGVGTLQIMLVKDPNMRTG